MTRRGPAHPRRTRCSWTVMVELVHHCAGTGPVGGWLGSPLTCHRQYEQLTDSGCLLCRCPGCWSSAGLQRPSCHCLVFRSPRAAVWSSVGLQRSSCRRPVFCRPSEALCSRADLLTVFRGPCAAVWSSAGLQRPSCSRVGLRMSSCRRPVFC